MIGCEYRSIVKTLLLFRNTSLQVCSTDYFIAKLFTSPLCFIIHTHHATSSALTLLQSALAAVSSFSSAPSTILPPNLFFMNMALKRKATDAGLSTSPLKKRNAVTAGIGRAADSESNGIGFGYYGRTDDREDVSKSIPPSLYSSFLVWKPQLTCQCAPMSKATPSHLGSGSTANFQVEAELGCLHILWWPR